MTYWDLYKDLTQALSFRGNAANESRWLIEHLVGGKLLCIGENLATDEDKKFIENAVANLRNGVPFQYIIGETDFYGLSFMVNKNVLIPRPETEVLVETAISWGLSLERPCSVLDICTGSGCIIVTLAKHLEGTFTAGDISTQALELARTNAAFQNVTVDFRQGDLLNVVCPGEKFDIITANPPYLSQADMEAISTEVGNEPSLALYGGADGLDFCCRLIQGIPQLLNSPGLFLMEIGETQGEAVLAMAKTYFSDPTIKKDLCGKPRFLWASI